MTASDLARIWGCTRQGVAKWVAKGMPLTSEQDASNWRMLHGSRSPRCRVAVQARGIPISDTLLQMEGPVPNENEQAAEARQRWNRAKMAERTAEELLNKAKAEGDVMNIRLALDKVIATQERARDSSEEYATARAAAGLMMHRSEHDEMVEKMAAEFQRGLEGIVNKADKLANQPVENVHAILREDVSRTYESIRQRMTA